MGNKNVYILLTDTGSLLSKMIKLYTKKPYNHASISFDSQLFEVYSFGRKRADNPFNGGFVKEDIRQGLFRQADCAIYSLTVSDEQMEHMKNLIREMERQKDAYRYHFIGLFGFLLNKPITSKNAFFCSQFVATILVECHLMNAKKPLSLIAPADLQQIAGLKLMYEGKLYDYLHNHDEWYHPYQAIV